MKPHKVKLFNTEESDEYVQTVRDLLVTGGTPGERIENGQKIKYINVFLDAFKQMYPAVENAVKFLNIEANATLDALCIYARQANYIDMNNITKITNDLLESWRAGSTAHRDDFISLMQKIEKESMHENFNYNDVFIYFHRYIKVPSCSTKYYGHRYNYTHSADRTENLFLQDNNDTY